MKPSMVKRKRRKFTPEFKADTVRLVRQSGKSIAEIARDLDLTESALRGWVAQADIDDGQGQPGELTTTEREELVRLRRENKQLQQEREILRAWEWPSRSSRRRNGPRGIDETAPA